VWEAGNDGVFVEAANSATVNVTVTNCTVYFNSDTGINVSDAIVTGCTVTWNDGTGIYLTSIILPVSTISSVCTR